MKMEYEWLLLVFPGCHLILFQGDWFKNMWKHGWTATIFLLLGIIHNVMLNVKFA